MYSSVQKSGQRLPYEGAVGSATRRLFKKLPGAGARTAKLWWDLGFRCTPPAHTCADGLMNEIPWVVEARHHASGLCSDRLNSVRLVCQLPAQEALAQRCMRCL